MRASEPCGSLFLSTPGFLTSFCMRVSENPCREEDKTHQKVLAIHKDKLQYVHIYNIQAKENACFPPMICKLQPGSPMDGHHGGLPQSPRDLQMQPLFVIQENWTSNRRQGLEIRHSQTFLCRRWKCALKGSVSWSTLVEMIISFCMSAQIYSVS